MAPTHMGSQGVQRRRFLIGGMSALAPMPLGARADSTVRIFLCGDVMTGRGIDQVLPHPNAPQLYERYVASAMDYVRLAERRNGPIPRPVACSYIWGEARAEWARRRPHVRIMNLETSLTTSLDHATDKEIHYRMSPRNAACLTASGADCFVLSNNHVLDWGEAGLIETLRVLNRLGVKVCGAGPDAGQAAAPTVLPAPGGARVIVVGFCTEDSGVPANWAAGPSRPGVRLVEPRVEVAVQLARQLAAIRRPRDIVVASIHWGPNWGYGVPPAHRRLAHALIDIAGVSIVHGHSSHHPMAIEVHNGRLILYGCGDFLNDYEGIEGHEAYRSDLSLMYFADVDAATGALRALGMKPLQMRNFRLNRPSETDTAWIRSRLDRECRPFGARVRRRGAALELAWAQARVA